LSLGVAIAMPGSAHEVVRRLWTETRAISATFDKLFDSGTR
jgi:hypothetical protein